MEYILKFIFIITLSSFVLCDNVNEPEVKTPYGVYKGEIIKSVGGRDIIAYKGVPFAQPPVGKLRLKGPVKLNKNVKASQSSGEKMCVQPEMSLFPNNEKVKIIGEEDCLYLNIYVPKLETNELLPVFFSIHGGGYFGGSGAVSWSDPGIILDKDRNMIMVAINYRLGPLGFLSVDDESIPENIGMKDQVMALKWVIENIREFGGDPDSITIGGISAGASSVSLHLSSKASKGLFHRAISQSGTADCPWALIPIKHARQTSSKILSILGCSAQSGKLLECLQKLPANEIVASLNKLNIPEVSFRIHLSPVVEEDSPDAFITKESLEKGSTLPWLTGVTNEEALLFYQMLSMSEHKYSDLSVLKQDYKKFLPLINYYDGHPNSDEISQRLVDYYFKNGFSKETVTNFINMVSDSMFNHGLHVSSKKYNGKLYQYLLAYRGKNTLALIRPKGTEKMVSHGDDMFYFYPSMPGFPVVLNEEDRKLSNTLNDMWYNFIKTGNPTPKSQIWEESDGGKKYLNISNEGLKMSSDLFEERMNFLNKLVSSNSHHEEL